MLLARTALCTALIPAGGCGWAGQILTGPKACCGARHVSPHYPSVPYSPNIVQMHRAAFHCFPYSFSWPFLTESLWSKRGWSGQHTRYKTGFKRLWEQIGSLTCYQIGLPGGSSAGLVESPVFFGKGQNVEIFFRKRLFSLSTVLTIIKWKFGALFS